MVPSSHPPRRRWPLHVGLGILMGAFVAHWAVPAIVASVLRAKLEAAGFEHADLEVTGLAFGELGLSNVSLGDGLDLNDVHVDGGLSLLWRDPATAEVTVRNARITASALGALPIKRTSPTAAPFGRLRFDHAMLAIGGAQVTVSGMIDLRSRAVDLVARAPSWRLGALVLRDVIATVHGDGSQTNACVTAHVHTATFDACGMMPPSFAALDSVRALDLTWRIVAPAWHGRGTGTVDWSTGELALARGHAELEAPAEAVGFASFEPVTVTADVAGTLSTLALDVTGQAHTEVIALREGTTAATFRQVALPFALHVAANHGEVEVHAVNPLIATSTEATLERGASSVAVIRPTLVFANAGEVVTWPRPVRWTADEAWWNDVHLTRPSGLIGDENEIAWTSITGLGPISGGAGTLAFAIEPGRVRVVSGRIAVAGGVVSVAPFVATGQAPIEVVLQVDNLELDRVFRALGHGKISGTGVLDGQLVLRLGGDDSTIVSGALRSRGRGALRLADTAWRAKAAKAAEGLAIQNRVVGALGDFEYADLSAVLGPRDSDPELRLAMRGRGKQVPQDLDVVVNLRGVRDAALHIARARE